MEPFDFAELGPIHEDGHGFRLLRLFSGSGPQIRCELFKAYIRNSNGDKNDQIYGMPHEALSYTWGSSEKDKTIIVNGKSFKITSNQFLALWHLRFEHEDRIIWADGICIDQSHKREKNHQAMHMSSIYSEAERVLIWLGEASHETNLFTQALKRLERLSFDENFKSRNVDVARWGRTHPDSTYIDYESYQQDYICVLKKKMGDARWEKVWHIVTHADDQSTHIYALEKLLENSWFKRVWILQECAHAKSAIVVCGKLSVVARIFSIAPNLLGITPPNHCQAVLDIMPRGKLFEISIQHELVIFGRGLI